MMLLRSTGRTPGQARSGRGAARRLVAGACGVAVDLHVNDLGIVVSSPFAAGKAEHVAEIIKH